MHISSVSAVSITWARSPAERDLLTRALQRLAAHDLCVTIADRTEPALALDALPTGARWTILNSSGATLVGQVQAAFAGDAPHRSSYVLYSEPDKELFFEHHLARFLARAPLADDVGIVLASRSPASFGSFPPIQRHTEQTFNVRCGQLLGVEADYCYGPFLVHRSLVPEIARLPDDLGWGWRPAIFRIARELGFRVLPVVGDYACPPDQRHEAESDREHRLRQLSQNLRALEA